MSQDNWVDAIAVDELPSDDVKGVVVAGRDIAIYTVGDDIFATDNVCTHGQARLCDGFLDGHEIECPLHQGKFDVRNGRPTCDPVTESLRSYPVRIEGQRVFLQID
ncbi:non-heme iron oxygenase ferredoxin subunit [Caldimonas sp. KR1-144]|uniref:non-heme iron oxygenase ferredoxin subunit n=1 Tax=Caldimonas sp. KR1-144 TaxID=3400911 RepID=UPI003BFC8488